MKFCLKCGMREKDCICPEIGAHTLNVPALSWKGRKTYQPDRARA